jgi:hypothetical protein
VFYAFDGALDVSDRPQYRPDLPLLIGCDFNVDPMAWVLAHEVAPKMLEVFDELFLRNTNTAASLVWLAKRYGQHPNEVRFYGDATGKARKTSANESDYVQIRNTHLFASGATRVYFPLSNPPVQDRFAATNAMFCSASGKRRLSIHSRCRNLIRDIEQRAYEPGTTVPDDHDDVGHITDALGYMVFQTCPLRLALRHSSPEVSAV